MSDAVQQIKDRLTILDVISPYVELHKAGRHYKGRCPFHSEKTPSFQVSPDQGLYYCFGCSEGGDMFSFMSRMEGVDFKEALKILAGKAGVELVPENPKAKDERERLLALIEAAVSFYEARLKEEPGALEYLAKRGVKSETIAAWRIGFAPGPPRYGWRHVKEYLEKLGYAKAEIARAGLSKTGGEGKEPFDVFRDRVMFPMADQHGKVVAFSGRILSKDTDAPKYVNSPETELYKKSELLFGYDKAKHGIRKLGFSLIVEGQFDVVMCHQAGYHNAVAVSGTALTAHHVMLLERLSDKVVLALDADRAGIAAAKRAAELMLRRGLDVKVAQLPDGQDPADLLQSDPAAFKRIIGRSQPVITVLFDLIKAGASDERALKLKVREEVLPYVVLIPNRIDQEHFMQQLATGLGTSLEAIKYEVDRLREEATERATPATPVAAAASATVASPRSTTRERELYEYLLVATTLLNSEEASPLLQVLKELSVADRPQIKDLSAPTHSRLVFELEQFISDATPLQVREDMIDKLNQLCDAVLKRELAEQRAKLAVATDSDDETVSGLLESIKGLQQRRAADRFTTDLFTQKRDKRD